MWRTNRMTGFLAAVASLLLLAGCSTWSFQPPMRGNPNSYWFTPGWAAAAAGGGGPTFQQSLAKEYADYSAQLSAWGDWADSDYFARKSLTTASSGPTPPEDQANWAIPLEYPLGLRSMLKDARARLVAALDAGGRDRLPQIAAVAQSRYDCWVERMEDDWQSAQNGDCRKAFEAALCQLTGKCAPAPAGAHQFNVYFEFDRANLTADARRIVADIIAEAKHDGNVTIMLVGKADLTGSDPYNMGLSHRRADTVRAALTAGGIPAGAIQERWVGFHEPPVPTPMGVREPRNRVVEVTIQ
jgi:OmpA-OmpF porin, OOP family